MSKKPEPEQPAQPEPKFLRSNRFRGGYEMKEFKPRLDRSAMTRRIVVIGSLVTLALTVLLVAAAAIQLLIVEPNRAVATVGPDAISATDFQRRTKLEFSNTTYNLNQLAAQINQLQASGDEGSQFLVQIYQQQFEQSAAQVDAGQIANSAMNSLIADKIIRQEAVRRGLTASSAEALKLQQERLGYFLQTPTPFPTATPEPPQPGVTITLPTATPRAQPTSVSEADYTTANASGEKFFTDLGYPASEFVKSYEQSVIIQKLQASFAEAVTKTAPHVQLSYVRFNEEATATAALARLTSGAIAFDALISATNAITEPAAVGTGEALGWTLEDDIASQFGDGVLAALRAAPLNKATGVLTSTQGGFLIVLPTGREVRALSPSDLQSRQQAAYQDWLTAAVTNTDLVKKLVDPATLVPRDVRNNIAALRQQLGLP